VIFEACSPNGNVWAVVEADSETCYFYLHADPALNLPLRSCWIRNLKPAPEQLDLGRMREGNPPMQPRQYCKHPQGAACPDREALSVIWSEEGDGAALCENNEIIAILARGSVTDEVDGFSLECKGEGPLSHELEAESDSYRRFLQSKDYWDSWSHDDGPWPIYQQAGLAFLNASLGAYSNYYAIDGGKWPPKALLRFNQVHSTTLITLGMGLRAQPAIELYDTDFHIKRRIELAIHLGTGEAGEAVGRFAGYLSGQSSFPWSFATFLGHGHTLPSDVLTEVTGGKFCCFLLDSSPPHIPFISWPEFRHEPVTALWMRAISEKEREFAEQNSSSELLRLLNKLPLESIYSLSRDEVI